MVALLPCPPTHLVRVNKHVMGIVTLVSLTARVYYYNITQTLNATLLLEECTRTEMAENCLMASSLHDSIKYQTR